MPSSSNAGARVTDRTTRDDFAADLVEVPAAVVCAVCGTPDCTGCALDEATNASGVVAIIPWERPGVAFSRRLWQTAELTTLHSRTFFGALPEGEVSPALAFALVSETIAVSGLAAVAASLSLLFLPELPRLMLEDPSLRATVTRGALSGIFGLVIAMVSVHAAHGLALDLAARQYGARKRGRGLRFGLYACGWDLVTLPLGLLTLALLGGLAAARRAAPLGLTAPLQSAQAYLVGVHGLDPATAALAARRATYFAALPVLAFLLGGALFVARALR